MGGDEFCSTGQSLGPDGKLQPEGDCPGFCGRIGSWLCPHYSGTIPSHCRLSLWTMGYQVNKHALIPIRENLPTYGHQATCRQLCRDRKVWQQPPSNPLSRPSVGTRKLGPPQADAKPGKTAVVTQASQVLP
ncbi:hypothetical protein P7K49_029914 [Saguinus oedipus]|uniref:Uncharacterized protein n=1 Tax=Saguinus oedipus TaxID=9490 RepID=A0ABQ9U9E1_SAGOE|nr:hypothetical protein P7K49_029914 [Saguinus oedipus]